MVVAMKPARLVMALASVGVAWVLVSPASPPLYDGLGFPDEPYRYVTPPAGATTTAPTEGALQTALSGKVNFLVQTGENGPQASFDIPRSALEVSGGATSMTMRLTPTAAAAALPQGQVWGNVYHLSVQGDRGSLKIVKSQDGGFIQLRAPQAPPPTPVIEYNDGSGWRALTTTRAGNDVFAAPAESTGDYALVTNSGHAVKSGRGLMDSPGLAVAVILIGLGVLTTLIVLAIRFGRMRQAGG